MLKEIIYDVLDELQDNMQEKAEILQKLEANAQKTQEIAQKAHVLSQVLKDYQKTA